MALGVVPSYLGLCIAQSALVAVSLRPRARTQPGKVGIVVPALALVVGVWLIRVPSNGPLLLTWAAAVATPAAAAVAGWIAGVRSRWLLASLVVGTYLLAWRVPSLAGETADCVLIGTACLAAAALLSSVATPRSIRIGLVLLALADVVLVWGTRQVGPATVALDKATLPSVLGRPLPALQEARLGSALVGWLDLFAAALLGRTLARKERLPAGAVMLVAAASWGLLLAVTSPIPATVPVVVVLFVIETRRRWRARTERACAGPRSA